jgi:hypothetical protein
MTSSGSSGSGSGKLPSEGSGARKLPDKLPDETLPRTATLVKNSAPNANRPRLSDEAEARLAPIEAESASCYAGIEDASDKFRKLAATIAGGDGADPDEEEDDRERYDEEDPTGEVKKVLTPEELEQLEQQRKKPAGDE